jgi:hypothetical protein
MVRRFVALLIGLFMAHLTIVGSDFACAKHPGDAAGLHHSMAHHEGPAMNIEHAENDDAPCRTPSLPMCCQASTSCAVAVAIAESHSVHQVAARENSLSESVGEIPPSEIIAPDPPPPRA